MSQALSHSVKVIPWWKPNRCTRLGNFILQAVSFLYPPSGIQGVRLVYEADDPEPNLLNVLMTLGSIVISILCILIYMIYKRYCRAQNDIQYESTIGHGLDMDESRFKELGNHERKR